MLAIRFVLASAILLSGASCARRASAQDHTIDTAHSVLKILVSKSGLFSAFAHNHEIAAPIAEGTVRLSSDASVALQVHAHELRVVDPGVPSGERGDVQKTMEGPEVLDVQRFPEISFHSTGIQKKDDQHWIVRGNLTMHGRTSPVEVEVAYKDGHYQGSAQLRQHDFGMTPVTIAGGAVKVKDEVKIEFDFVLK
jgi:polyisoprenoid-binding protein YceI